MSEINIIVPKDLQEKDSDDDSIIINEDVFYQKDQDESEDESIIWNEDQEGECSFLIKRKDTNSGKKKLNTNKNVTKIKKEEKSNIKKLSDSYINSLYQNIKLRQVTKKTKEKTDTKLSQFIFIKFLNKFIKILVLAKNQWQL